jgi:hypothetical protein
VFETTDEPSTDWVLGGRSIGSQWVQLITANSVVLLRGFGLLQRSASESSLAPGPVAGCQYRLPRPPLGFGLWKNPEMADGPAAYGGIYDDFPASGCRLIKS